MRAIILAFIFSARFAIAGPEVTTVYSGCPTSYAIDNGEDSGLRSAASGEGERSRCVISCIGGRFYWATRENIELLKIDKGGAYVLFNALNGAGYIKVLKADWKKVPTLLTWKPPAFDYMEHFHSELVTFTYRGVTRESKL